MLPNKTQAKRARRTLRLRSGVWSRRGLVWLAKTPARHWDRIWAKVPQAPKPLTHYTEQHKMKTATGPKRKTPNPSPTSPTPSPISNVIPINRKAVRAMSDPVDGIIEAFQQLAQFHPGSAREVEQVLTRQQEMFAQIAAAYHNWADQLSSGMPFEQAVADSVREIGSGTGALASLATNAHATFRAAHAADIARIEQPRPDEGMWDPGANR